MRILYEKQNTQAKLCQTNIKNHHRYCLYVSFFYRVYYDLSNFCIYNKRNRNELHLAFVCCVICKVKFLNMYFNPFESNFYSAINECRNLLSEAEKLYSKFENKYGLYRIDFIRAFLDLYSGIQNESNKKVAIDTFRQKITDLKEISYYREYEMINSILKYKKIKVGLIERFFKFYPIVLQ